jgi:hypothetical protein
MAGMVALSWWLGTAAYAQSTSCTEAERPTVFLRSRDPELERIAVQLAVGLAASGVAVCTGDAPLAKHVATVEIVADPARESSRQIRVRDQVTSKTLERAVELGAIPPDSRATALALYVEELLQASWAELALDSHGFLREHPPAAPLEVQRELARVLPTAAPAAEGAASARVWRISFGAAFATFPGMLTQLGPQLSVGYRALPWLEPALRVGYRASPVVHAPDGTIAVQALLAGAYVDLLFALSRTLSVHFPQGLDVSHVTFLTGANAGSPSVASATRAALVVEHGAGLRFHLADALSITTVARFCWTLLRAQAADDQHVVAGISGVGLAAEISLDGHL